MKGNNAYFILVYFIFFKIKIKNLYKEAKYVYMTILVIQKDLYSASELVSGKIDVYGKYWTLL